MTVPRNGSFWLFFSTIKIMLNIQSGAVLKKKINVKFYAFETVCVTSNYTPKFKSKLNRWAELETYTKNDCRRYGMMV